MLNTIKYKKGDNLIDYIYSEGRFKHLDRPTAELIAALADIELPERDNDMCKAIEQMKNQCVKEGLSLEKKLFMSLPIKAK